MFKELNPLLHSELRLAVVSILIGVESADFVFIRQQTGATAGNLSVQLDKLAKAGYIEVEKTFRGKIPCTVCRITDAGRDAFAEYVEVKRALYFITCDGRMMYNTKLDESYITRHLIYNERPDTMLLADNKSCTYEQMSIFDFISE